MISHVHSSATRERGNPDFCRSRDFPFLKFLLDRITNYKHFLSLADWFVGSFLILPEVRVALSVRFLEFEVWKRHAQGILFLPSSLASLFGVGRPLMKLSWTSFPRGWNLLRVSVLSLGIVCWLRLIFIRFAAWEFSTRDQRSSASFVDGCHIHSSLGQWSLTPVLMSHSLVPRTMLDFQRTGIFPLVLRSPFIFCVKVDNKCS